MEQYRSEQVKQELTLLFESFCEACSSVIQEESKLYSLLVIGLYASLFSVIERFLGELAIELNEDINEEWITFMKQREFWKNKKLIQFLDFNELPNRFSEYARFSIDFQKITKLKLLVCMFPQAKCLKTDEAHEVMAKYKKLRDLRHNLVHTDNTLPSQKQVYQDQETLVQFLELLVELKNELTDSTK